MKEFEITVLIENSKEEINKIVKPLNKVRDLTSIDTYMIKEEIDINKMNNLEILDNSILIREIAKGIYLNKKVKKYDENGNTIDRSAYWVKTRSKEEAYDFLVSIGYKEAFILEDVMHVYDVNGIEFIMQYVKDIGIMIEIEAEELDDIEGFKKDSIKLLKKLGFMFNEKNIDVKKAEIMLEKIKENHGRKNIL